MTAIPTDTEKHETARPTDTLSVQDNRTDRQYELEIKDDTVSAIQLRQIKIDDGDFGLKSFDPGYTNTAVCHSDITYIDGDNSILEYRGYRIEDLCGSASYLEVAYLVLFGVLPTTSQYEQWVHDVTHHTFVHENIKKFMEGFRHDAHPMGMLLSTTGALSTFYPSAKNIYDDRERYWATVRLVAKMPTLTAFAYRHQLGLPYNYPSNDYGYVENLLLMLYRMTERDYRSDRRVVQALETLFILHADHELNCSTNAVRAVGSSGVDPYSAISAGIAALYGPAHGGANEAVIRMLERIGSPDNVPGFLERVKNREERLMGFGHRVYKNLDPRAEIIKSKVAELYEVTGVNPKLQIAQELERRALDDEYFQSRKLYPNVDFFSGLIYEALGLPKEMYTLMFAIPRTVGWMAHWSEQVADKEQKIARPRQIYTGNRNRRFHEIAERD